MCGSHSTVRGLLKDIPSEPGTVVIDLEASPEHMTRATTRHVDHMLLVAEPYFKSLETARRYHRLAVDLDIPMVSVIGNKVRPEEGDVVADYCADHSFRLLATVPYEPSFAEAERAGAAPIDWAPDSAGVESIRRLAERLEARV
ncbi:MAG: hypothetical protein M3N51_06670 [Actinomycetota bacterium]|nr:hypothetical protein [Actinomycetota bacterium]